MASQGALSVLHTKSIRVQSVSLCSTLDLCAFITVEGSICVFRTVSWEKVWSKDSTDFFTTSSCPCKIAFCVSGRTLAVCFPAGEVGVIDIETLAATLAHQRCMKFISGLAEGSSPVELCWTQLDEERFAFAGHQQLPSFAEPGVESNTRTAEDIIESSCSALLFVSSSNNWLIGYRFGLWPMFVVNLNFSFCIGEQIGSGGSELLLLDYSESAENVIKFATATLFDNSRLTCRTNVHITSLCCFKINMQLSAMQTALSSLGKKWTEATKPINAKLTFLQSSLDAYQIPMSMIDVLYSAVTCGLWHPSLATHFGQYWNDQSLQRLKSSVELVLDSVIWNLSLRVLSNATNSLVFCRELEKLFPNSSSVPTSGIFDRIVQFRRSLEDLLITVDEAIAAAKEARTAMNTYFKFIKDCMNLSQSPASFVDGSMSGQYADLFDCRKPRCSAKYSEFVTGTFLFMYLQDNDTANNLGSCIEPHNCSRQNDICNQHFLEKIHRLQLLSKKENDPPHSEFSTQFTPSRSLMAKIRRLEDDFDRLHVDLLSLAPTNPVSSDCSAYPYNSQRISYPRQWQVVCTDHVGVSGICLDGNSCNAIVLCQIVAIPDDGSFLFVYILGQRDMQQSFSRAFCATLRTSSKDCGIKAGVTISATGEAELSILVSLREQEHVQHIHMSDLTLVSCQGRNGIVLGENVYRDMAASSKGLNTLSSRQISVPKMFSPYCICLSPTRSISVIADENTVVILNLNDEEQSEGEGQSDCDDCGNNDD